MEEHRHPEIYNNKKTKGKKKRKKMKREKKRKNIFRRNGKDACNIEEKGW